MKSGWQRCPQSVEHQCAEWLGGPTFGELELHLTQHCVSVAEQRNLVTKLGTAATTLQLGKGSSLPWTPRSYFWPQLRRQQRGLRCTTRLFRPILPLNPLGGDHLPFGNMPNALMPAPTH